MHGCACTHLLWCHLPPPLPRGFPGRLLLLQVGAPVPNAFATWFMAAGIPAMLGETEEADSTMEIIKTPTHLNHSLCMVSILPVWCLGVVLSLACVSHADGARQLL